MMPDRKLPRLFILLSFPTEMIMLTMDFWMMGKNQIVGINADSDVKFVEKPAQKNDVLMHIS